MWSKIGEKDVVCNHKIWEENLYVHVSETKHLDNICIRTCILQRDKRAGISVANIIRDKGVD